MSKHGTPRKKGGTFVLPLLSQKYETWTKFWSVSEKNIVLGIESSLLEIKTLNGVAVARGQSWCFAKFDVKNWCTFPLHLYKCISGTFLDFCLEMALWVEWGYKQKLICHILQKPFPPVDFILYSFEVIASRAAHTAPNFPSAPWIFYRPCTTWRLNVSSLQESMFAKDILLHVTTEPCQWLVLCRLVGVGCNDTWSLKVFIMVTLFALN